MTCCTFYCLYDTLMDLWNVCIYACIMYGNRYSKTYNFCWHDFFVDYKKNGNIVKKSLSFSVMIKIKQCSFVTSGRDRPNIYDGNWTLGLQQRENLHCRVRSLCSIEAGFINSAWNTLVFTTVF